MILELAQQLAAQVGHLSRQGEIEELVHRSEERHDDLAELLADLGGLADFAQAAQSRGIPAAGFPKPEVKAARQHLTKVQGTLTTGVAEALRSPDLAALIGKLRRLKDTASAWARSTWTAQTAKSPVAIDEDLLGLFEHVGLKPRNVVGIRNRVLTLSRLRNEPWITGEEWDQYDRAMAEIGQMWDALGAAQLDPEVEEFLRAAISGDGAPLGLLTQAVVDWLWDTSAHEFFRVRPL